MSLENDGGMILTGERRRTRRKTCPSATLSTKNPTWIDPGANPSLRWEVGDWPEPWHGPTTHLLVPFRVYHFVSKRLPFILFPRCTKLHFTPIQNKLQWLRFSATESRLRYSKRISRIFPIWKVNWRLGNDRRYQLYKYSRQTMRWSLRGVNILSVVRGGVQSMQVDRRLPIGQR
jgi:hypothetical protein